MALTITITEDDGQSLYPLLRGLANNATGVDLGVSAAAGSIEAYAWDELENKEAGGDFYDPLCPNTPAGAVASAFMFLYENRCNCAEDVQGWAESAFSVLRVEDVTVLVVEEAG